VPTTPFGAFKTHQNGAFSPICIVLVIGLRAFLRA
jgi:hypothetical protein